MTYNPIGGFSSLFPLLCEEKGVAAFAHFGALICCVRSLVYIHFFYFFFSGNVSCLQVVLQLRRDLGQYWSELFLPDMILVATSFLTFWLDWSSVPARAILGVGKCFAPWLAKIEINQMQLRLESLFETLQKKRKKEKKQFTIGLSTEKGVTKTFMAKNFNFFLK